MIKFETIGFQPRIKCGKIKKLVPQKLEDSVIELGKDVKKYSEINAKDIATYTSQALPIRKGNGLYRIHGSNDAHLDLKQENEVLEKSIHIDSNNFIQTRYYNDINYYTEIKSNDKTKFSTTYHDDELVDISEYEKDKRALYCIHKFKDGVTVSTSTNKNSSFSVSENEKGEIIRLSEIIHLGDTTVL